MFFVFFFSIFNVKYLTRTLTGKLKRKISSALSSRILHPEITKMWEIAFFLGGGEGVIQGIIQKKSASGTVFLAKTKPKVSFFKDSWRCPKILDYNL